MSALIHEQLFKFITDIDPNYSIENTLKYLKKEALMRNISDQILELAWNEEFAALAGGKIYSTIKCSCGCGQDKPGTDFIHAIRDRMISIDKKQTTIIKNFMQERYQLFVQEEMKRISTFNKEREKLINGSLWERLTNWSASPVYCYFKYKDYSLYKLNKASWKLKRIKKYLGK